MPKGTARPNTRSVKNDKTVKNVMKILKENSVKNKAKKDKKR